MNEKLLVITTLFWILGIVLGQVDLKNSKFDKIVFTLGYMVPILLDSLMEISIL